MTRAAVACALGLLVAWAALAAPEAVTILRDAYGVPHQPPVTMETIPVTDQSFAITSAAKRSMVAASVKRQKK